MSNLVNITEGVANALVNASTVFRPDQLEAYRRAFDAETAASRSGC